MKKIILILVILGIAVGVWYLDKINKEKAIFGGQTKASVIRTLRSKWEVEYKRTQKIWIKDVYDTDDTYKEEFDTKAEESNRTVEQQLTADVNWLWENHPENRHPYVFGDWRKSWVISQTEDMGIDTTMDEVQAMLRKV